MRTWLPRRRSRGSASAGTLTTLGRGCVCATLTKPSESWAGWFRSTCRATRPRPSLSSCNRLSRSYWAWRSRCEVGQPIQEGLIHIDNQPSPIVAGLRLPVIHLQENLFFHFVLTYCVASTLASSLQFACIALRREEKMEKKGRIFEEVYPCFSAKRLQFSSYFSFSCFPCFSPFLFPPCLLLTFCMFKTLF